MRKLQGGGSLFSNLAGFEDIYEFGMRLWGLMDIFIADRVVKLVCKFYSDGNGDSLGSLVDVY
jgi:hypothetical protein